jgi:hypothetical protein
MEYDVHSLSLTIDYNKTVLYPMDTLGVTDRTLTSSMHTQSQSTVYGANDASTTLRFADGSLVASDTGAVLVRLAFRMLHGNAISTTVRISAATFEDNNPRVGRINPAIARADSLCYQIDRLIDASARYGASFKMVVSGPNVTSVRYEVSDAHFVSLALYDGIGRLVRTLESGEVTPREYETTFATSGLANGAYYLRLQTDRGAETQSIRIVR